MSTRKTSRPTDDAVDPKELERTILRQPTLRPRRPPPSHPTGLPTDEPPGEAPDPNPELDGFK